MAREVAQRIARWIVSALDPCVHGGHSLADPPADTCLHLSPALAKHCLAHLVISERYARVKLGCGRKRVPWRGPVNRVVDIALFEYVHRLACWLKDGYLPGHVVVHKGRNLKRRGCKKGTHCVNPLHLDWDTQAQNRQMAWDSQSRRKLGKAVKKGPTSAPTKQ